MGTCAVCQVQHGRMRTSGRPAAYCRGCHAAYMRRTRPRHSELPEVKRRKANSRAYANVYQRRGKLIPKPCAGCGVEGVEKHHDDYSKPLQVEWLCRPCHLARHVEHT